MKATGIVRRIDDLGRVVIPKEIRRTMRIREGDPLEIYTDHEGEVIFKKYSPIEELSETAAQFAEASNKTCGFAVVIIDRDMIVACAGVPKKEMLEHKISPDIDSLIEARQLYTWRSDDKKLHITDRQDKYFAKVVMPIFSEGDIIGAVGVIDTENLTEPSECEIKLVQTAALFFGKQLEH
jgi:AbrB family transcriptional regulator (stage V sporulation protein T)